MDKVFICSPYKGNPKKNLENAIGYCRKADIYSKLPIAPHVYFTRVFPEESWCSRYTGMAWGTELMQYCSEIWIFCNELTEGMIKEIAEARKLGLKMKFYNVAEEEINGENYLIHTELGPAYRKLIAESYGDRFYVEGGYGDCSACRRGGCTDGNTENGNRGDAETGAENEPAQDCGKTVPRGIFDWIFKRK